MKCFHHLESVDVSYQYVKWGIEILGTPVGSDIINEACLRKVQREKSLLSKLSLLQDAQIGALILRCT